MNLEPPPPPTLDSWARALAGVEGIDYSPDEEAFLSGLAQMSLSSEQRAQAALSYLGYPEASA